MPLKAIKHFCRCGRYADEFEENEIEICKCHRIEFDKIDMADCCCEYKSMCFCCAEDSLDNNHIGHIECLHCGRRWNRGGPETNWEPNRKPVTMPSGRKRVWSSAQRGFVVK